MPSPLPTEVITDGEFSLSGTLQKALDLMQQGLDEGVRGLLARSESKIIPVASFWCYRQIGLARNILHGTELTIDRQAVQIHLNRAQELARTMPPHGELCILCAQEDELTAPQVDGQLILPHQHQPIPVCADHASQIAEQMGLQNIEIVPITPLWPPWTRTPPWLNRMINTYSEERSFYACYQAALAGDVDAMFQMGQNYELGHGVAMSSAGAEDWYTRAAKKGYPGAQEAVERVQRGGAWKPETEVPWWME